VADVPLGAAFGITGAFLVGLTALALVLLGRGVGLKS